MDFSDLNASLQDMVNLSSSETEEKEESLRPIKKKKTTAKSKAPKKIAKYRARKTGERQSKVSKKSNAKGYETYQTKEYTKIKGMIKEETGDSNVLSELKDSTHLLPVIDILEKYNFKYEIKPDVNKQHDDFFLQDKVMMVFFKYYPDYLCVDLLSEITELELNLYLFIGVDANGHCEIVAMGLFRSTEAGLNWFCDVFKKHNPSWRKIKLITTDKKARNNENVKSEFPEKLILISFFHSMKALHKDLSNLDNKMTNEEITKVLQIFEQMIFAPDEATYTELLKQLKSMPPAVSTYFRKSWNQKKDSWALGTHLNSKYFLKSFNSYLNLIRKTIRPLVSTLDSVETVVKTLCSSIEQMRMGWFQKFTEALPTLHVNKQIALDKYSKFLTPHAVELVSEQINCSADVKNVKKLACGKYVYNEDIITMNTCSCNFYQHFLLPCVHIFSVRRLLSLPFYAESLCSPRWVMVNYQNKFMELQTVFASGLKNVKTEKNINPSHFQKYFKISAELWPVLLSCPENASRDRLLVFKNILNAWEHGIKVNIHENDSPKDSVTVDNVQEVFNDSWKDMYGVSLKDILDSDNDIVCCPVIV